MPLGLTPENARAVVAHHLSPGEEPLALIPLGRRILALTSANRVIFSSFPMFGRPKLLEEHPVESIAGVEYTMAGVKIILTVRFAQGTREFDVVQSPFFRSAEAVKTLAQTVFAANRNARPG